MKAFISRYSKSLLLPAISITVLSACGSMGDTASVKDANELAIACQTDKALLAVDRAAKSGGLSANIADLQRVVILRDAGRMSEAEAAMADRNARAGADVQAAAEAADAVSKSLEEMRAERQKETGRRVCP